ncbi:S8 family peptidase [Marinobacter sp. ELB17]|uniref:S8 family peptidase n=1 Tax=Marinobacter sp. ELB17 TaxID=270374 RepID=UPI0000F38348|nr:S8 family peptidase [Marinobacter sp. ELB17]EAZ98151.1 hypothetical protein MELB17_09713 [Marinobacter sp. ELB17]
MKTTLISMAIFAGTLTLAGCGGGGGGGGSSQGSTTTPVTPTPTVVNGDAKSLINAPSTLRAINVVVAIADSGINDSHDEFVGTSIDGRSGAFVTNDPLDADWDSTYKYSQVYSDGYEPEGTGGLVSHGTAVASLIYGKDAGLLSDSTLLAMDVLYSGSLADNDFDPAGGSPNALAGILATADFDKTFAVDFLNLSIDGTGTYLNVATFGNSEKAVYDEFEVSNSAIIGAAGNAQLDLTEIYASSTSACPEDPDGSFSGDPQGYAYERCYALKYDRNEKTLIPYTNDNLRDTLIMVVAVDNSGSIASFSNRPGTDITIQERFIAAPGVNLSVASHSSNSGFIRKSGTSFAAPLVTAAAAAVKSKFSSLTNRAVLQVLLNTADNSFAGYKPELHGMGILDIEAALNIDPSNYITP